MQQAQTSDSPKPNQSNIFIPTDKQLPDVEPIHREKTPRQIVLENCLSKERGDDIPINEYKDENTGENTTDECVHGGVRGMLERCLSKERGADIVEGDYYSEENMDPAYVRALALISSPQELSSMEKRRSYCGKRLGKKFKAIDGSYKKAQYHCGLWRDAFCPSCTRYRAKHFMGQVQNAVYCAKKDNRVIRRVDTDESGSKSLCAKLKKGQYRRFPQEDGSYIFFVDADSDKVEGAELEVLGKVEEVSWDATECMDWEKVSATPPDRRVTGSIGKKKEIMDDDEALIQVPNFTVHPDTTEGQEIEALLKTFEETKDLNPTTAKELEEALQKRTKVFVKHLRKLGCNLLHKVHNKTEKVKISHICWNHVYDLSAVQSMVIEQENDLHYGKVLNPGPIVH